MKKNAKPMTRFAEIRENRGIRKAHVARQIGELSTTIQKLEDGTNLISNRLAPMLAAAFHVAIDDLYAPIGAPIPPPPEPAVGELDAELGGEVVHDIEELTLLDIWRGMDGGMRRALLTLARGVRRKSDAA